MKMSKSQLNAISYAYSRREQKRLEREAESLGIDKLFGYQSKYKTLRGFLGGYKSKKILAEISERVAQRLAKLHAVNCTSSKLTEAQDAQTQVNKLLKSDGVEL